MNLEECCICINGATEQTFGFKRLGFGHEGSQHRFGFGNAGLIGLGFGQFEQSFGIAHAIGEVIEGVELLLETCLFLHQRFGGLRVVPEIGGGTKFSQFGKAAAGWADIKGPP